MRGQSPILAYMREAYTPCSRFRPYLDMLPPGDSVLNACTMPMGFVKLLQAPFWVGGGRGGAGRRGARGRGGRVAGRGRGRGRRGEWSGRHSEGLGRRRWTEGRQLFGNEGGKIRSAGEDGEVFEGGQTERRHHWWQWVCQQVISIAVVDVCLRRDMMCSLNNRCVMLIQ